ncbi:MAG: hypothetical protein M1827_007094 [Pycnora praestabilis]|nr:MAG: hypothetical protein M1827_007094 [Pycnora praestabilis]
MEDPSTSCFYRVFESFKLRLSEQDIKAFELSSFEDLKIAIDNIQKAQAARRGYRNLNKIKPFLSGLQQYSKVIEQFVSAKPAILAFLWDMFKDIMKKMDRSKELLLQTTTVTHFQNAQEHRVLFTRQFEIQAEKERNDRRVVVRDWLAATTCDLVHEELQHTRREFPQTSRWVFQDRSMRAWLGMDTSASPLFWLSGIPGAGKTVLFSSMVDGVKALLPQSQVVFFYCKYNDPCRNTFSAFARSVILQIMKTNPDCLEYLYENAISSGEGYASTMTLCSNLVETVAAQCTSLVIGIDGLDECDKPERQLILSLIEALFKNSATPHAIKALITSRKEKDMERALYSAIRLDMQSHHLKKDIDTYITTRASTLGKKFDLSQGQEADIKTAISHRPKGMFLLARLIMDNLLNQDTLEDLEEELDNKTLPTGIDQAYGRIMVQMLRNQPEKSKERVKAGLKVMVTSKRPLRIHELQGALCVRLGNQGLDFEKRRSVTPVHEGYGSLVEKHSDDTIDFVHPTAKQYLVQFGSFPFINLSTAELSMASLCCNYLTHDCFSSRLQAPSIEDHVRAGDYSFQEYATMHWLEHARIGKGLGNRVASTDESNLDTALALLAVYHQEQPSEDEKLSSCEDFESIALGPLMNLDLQELRNRYDTIEDIQHDKDDEISRPYLLQSLGEVRSILENLSRQADRNPKLFTEAYGTHIFKCPIIKCSHFHQGFKTQKERDEHLQRHTRSFICTEPDCDYAVIGFSSQSTLKHHYRLCHEPATDDISYPSRVQPRSIPETLEDAIDKDDAIAVRAIAAEALNLSEIKAGYLLRAVKKESNAAASVILDVLDAERETKYKDKKRMTALHIVAEQGNAPLARKMIQVCADINGTEGLGRSPLFAAVNHNRPEIVRILLEQSKVVFMTHGGRLDSKEREPIVNAAFGGHEDIVQMLLNKGGSRFVEYGKFHKVLRAAASNENESMILLLLSWGKSTGAEKHYPVSLQKAVLTSMEAAVNFLMKGKPDIDAKERTKGNILQAAAWEGDTERVLHLLKQGVNITRSSNRGRALIAAVRNNQLDTAQLLLEKGADTNLLSGNMTALIAAARNNNLDMVQLLLEKGADINKPSHSTTALIAAASKDNLDMVQLLLENGAGTNVSSVNLSSGSTTALIAAARINNLDIVQLLLENGADIDLSCGSTTALIAAASMNNLDMVQLLLEKGADIDLSCGSMTALIAAACYNKSGMVQLLVEKGADIDLSSGSMTALILAVSKNNLGMVQLLLEKGADINLSSYVTLPFGINLLSGNMTALIAAARNNNSDMVQLLVEKGADIDLSCGSSTALLKAITYGCEQVVQLLLNSGANMNMQNLDGSALYQAVERDNMLMTQLLLDKGAEVNTQSGYFGTPLAIAARRGNVQGMKLLLEKGADVNMEHAKRGHPLHQAVYAYSCEAMQLLLDSGADANCQGAARFKPIYVAAFGENKPAVLLLLEKGTVVDAADSGYREALQSLTQHKSAIAAEIEKLLVSAASKDVLNSSFEFLITS